jgi:NAD/NADP transhydrogenase beta subunit
MVVCEGHEVGSNGAVICVLQAREAERSRNKVTSSRFGRGWRLDWVQRASIVFGRMILVSGILAISKAFAACVCKRQQRTGYQGAFVLFGLAAVTLQKL